MPSHVLDAPTATAAEIKSPLLGKQVAGQINVEKIRRKIMSFWDAKQELAMLLRNGQLSIDEYEIELAALKYAHGEVMGRADDQRGVSA